MYFLLKLYEFKKKLENSIFYVFLRKVLIDLLIIGKLQKK